MDGTDLEAPSLSQWQTSYRVGSALGEGVSGHVWKITVPGCAPVVARAATPAALAVKVLRAGHSDNADALKNFFREARALKHASEQGTASEDGASSVVRFEGLVRIPPGAKLGSQRCTSSRYGILTELLEGGGLDALILRAMSCPHERVYTDHEALQLGLDVARGLAHLHAITPMIIHRDLSSKNVLMTSGRGGARRVAKIADLGLHVLLDCPRGTFLLQNAPGGQVLLSSLTPSGGPEDLNRIRGAQGAATGRAPPAPCSEQGGACTEAAPTGAPALQRSASAPQRQEASWPLPLLPGSFSITDPEGDQSLAAPSSGGSPRHSEHTSWPPCALGAAGEPPSASHAPLTISTLTRLSISGPNACLPATVKAHAAAGALHCVAVEAPRAGSQPGSLPIDIPAASASVRAVLSGLGELKGSSLERTCHLMQAANEDRDYEVTLADVPPPDGQGSPRASLVARSDTSAHRFLRRSAASPPVDSAAALDGTMDSCGAAGAMWAALVSQPPDAAQLLLESVVPSPAVTPAAGVGGAGAPGVDVPAAALYGMTGETGSYMYMAPEVFMGLPYNERCDVFSLGCILYEVTTRCMLVFTETPAQDADDARKYAARVAKGYRPAQPARMDPRLWGIVKACWDQDPASRPPASWVAEQLGALVAERAAPAAATARSSAHYAAAPSGAAGGDAGGGAPGPGCSCTIC